MSFTIKQALFGFGLVALMAAGCQEAEPTGAKGLRDITIPPGFTFETTREVVVTVSATEEKIGATHGALEIALPDGKVLYRGPLAVAQPLSINLAVPTKDTDLLLKVGSSGHWLAGTAAIASGAATFDFR
jgi:hypothetical protein